MPKEGRLEGVMCVVNEVFLGGEQSFCKPITPRKMVKQPGNKVIDDPGKWIQWIHLMDC